MDLKKTALALLTLGLTGVATAGGFMPAPACTNHPVTVPCERSAWDLGFTAYWVRPSSNFGSFFGTTSTSLGAFEDLVRYNHNHDHKFGFGLEASYHWGTGNDLNLNWTRFHKGENFDFVIDQDEVLRAGVDVRFDNVNLELAQMLNAGANWDIRSHMGLSWVRIDVDATADVATAFAEIPGGDFDRLGFESRVDGVGPRAGFDLAYRVSDNFSIVGHSAVSLLSGDRKSTLIDDTFVDGIRTVSDPVTTGNRHSVMLGAEGRVGLAWNSAMAQGNVSVEGGYSVQTYHDGIDLFGVITSPFNLDGVYLKAKYVS